MPTAMRCRVSDEDPAFLTLFLREAYFTFEVPPDRPLPASYALAQLTTIPGSFQRPAVATAAVLAPCSVRDCAEPARQL